MSTRLVGPSVGIFAFLLGFVVVFMFGRHVTAMIVEPLCKMMSGDGCELVFVAPKEAFLLNLRQALLAGLVCAMPSIVALLARVLAPTLTRETPEAVVPFAVAGGVIALAGVAFAIFHEAPGSFAPVLQSLADMSEGAPSELGFVTSYANAAVVMAGSFAFTLQLPVLALMMIKSLRTKRAMDAETTR